MHPRLKFQYDYFRGTTAFQRHFDMYLKFGFALFGMIWTVNENWLPQVSSITKPPFTYKWGYGNSKIQIIL